jgi:hypothetical protein
MTSGRATVPTHVKTTTLAPQWVYVVILGDGDFNWFGPGNVPPGVSVSTVQSGGFWSYEIAYQFNASTHAWGVVLFRPTPTSYEVDSAPFDI